MPLFEYRCEHCKKSFEFLAMSARERATECPTCGSRKVEKKLSIFATSRSSASDDFGDAGGESEGGDDTCGPCGGPPGSCMSGMGGDE